MFRLNLYNYRLYLHLNIHNKKCFIATLKFIIYFHSIMLLQLL